MKTVNALGLKCPQPLIMAKKALKENKEGESFNLITDSASSFRNIKTFLSDNKVGFTEQEEKGVYTLIISPTGKVKNTTDPETYCSTES